MLRHCNYLFCFIFVIFVCVHSRKVNHRFPCSSRSLPHMKPNGFCVPKRECCSTRHWLQSDHDHGDCHYQQFCCTENVLCQSCPNGTTEVKDDCIDINECKEIYGLCSGHRCKNTNGSYTCDCKEGYQISDDEPKTCNPIKRSKSYDLLFSASLTINLMTIRQLTQNRTQSDSIESKIRMIYSGTVTPQSIDYSLSGNYMAWIDNTLDQINMAPINSDEPSLVMDRVFLRFPKKPNCLTIDWIHDLLYWTDSKTRTVNVVNIKKPFDYYVVINNTNQEPNELIVNMFNNTLVWTHIGIKPRIMRSFQDGSNQSVLYSNSRQTFCLTIDIFINRYYFLDLDFTLYSINFEGKDERKIFRSQNLLNGINSMSVHYDTIFMSTNSLVYKINKFGYFDKWFGERAEALISSLTLNSNNDSFVFNNLSESQRQKLFNVKVIDPILQPKLENKCELSKCSHICLPSDPVKVFRCVCPPNTILVEDSVCSEKHFETFVIESMFWEKDLQKLIEHSITKSVALRRLLNQSYERQIDLSKLFSDNLQETTKMRQIFNLTAKHNYEIKKTFIQTINETLFWKRLLNSTFVKKNRFEKLLNQSYYSKNFTELLELLKNLTDEEESPALGLEFRIGELVLLGVILLAIISIIVLLIIIGRKFKSMNSRNSSPMYSSQSYRKPYYERPHEIRSVTDLETKT